ncbi:MAG: aminotransferase class III-fold pyridoxal phosphate-dependent enzyme [Kofleriaceae bacterium]
MGPDIVVGAAALAREAGCLFVLDEMRTCLRFGTAGYAAGTGVVPDLTTVGKAIANGYALAAVGGRADLMAAESSTHLNGTYETEALGLAAGVAMLRLAPQLASAHLTELYARLATAFNRAARSHRISARMLAVAGNAHVLFEDERQGTELYRQAAARGVLFYCFDDINLMFAHGPVLDELLAAVCDALGALSPGVTDGPPSLAAAHRYLVRHRIASKNSAMDTPLVRSLVHRLEAGSSR